MTSPRSWESVPGDMHISEEAIPRGPVLRIRPRYLESVCTVRLEVRKMRLATDEDKKGFCQKGYGWWGGADTLIQLFITPPSNATIVVSSDASKNLLEELAPRFRWSGGGET